jgi:hypothetical protein
LEYRYFYYREAIAVFSRAGRSAKNLVELNAMAFNSCLRMSACVCGKKNILQPKDATVGGYYATGINI